MYVLNSIIWKNLYVHVCSGLVKNESSIYMYIPYSLEIKVRFSYKYGGGAYN